MVICKNASLTISMEGSRRNLFIDMIVDRFIFNNNQITLSPCFTLKHTWDYLKQKLNFTVYGFNLIITREIICVSSVCGLHGLISLENAAFQC